MQSVVIMYATLFCPYCMRARRLLKNKKIEFEEIRVGSSASLWQEMREKTGGNTVPQIMIGGQAIGGYDDMALLDRENKLDHLFFKEQ